MQRIAIHSVPRSGSTWLGEIINSSPDVKYCFQPLFSYKYKDFLDENSVNADIDNFFKRLRDTKDDFICQRVQREIGILPKVKKSNLATHIVYKEVRYHNIVANLLLEDQSIKLILLVRDPIEVMNSWINTPKEFNPCWDTEMQLFSGKLKNSGKKENFYGLNAWIETTKLFENLAAKYRERVLFLKYSTLENNPELTAKHIYAFCGLPFVDETYNFLRKSSEKKVSDNYSVFRGGKKRQITLNEELVNLIISHVKAADLSNYINR